MTAPVEATGEVVAPPARVVFTGWLCYDPADPEAHYAAIYLTPEGSGVQPYRPTVVDPMRVVPVRVTVPVGGAA